MKSLIITSILFLSFSANAGFYLALSGSKVQQIDTTDEGDVNEDLLLEGTGFTGYMGYRFYFLAVEFFSKSITTEGKDGNLKFDYSNHMQGMGVRFYLFSFLNIKLGTLKNDASGDLMNGSTNLLDYESTSNNNYSGLGLNFPFGRTSLFLDYTQYASEHDTIDDSGIAMRDYEIGVRYMF